MQLKALLFIAMFAPIPAAAFGDLDCVSFETCTDISCDPATVTFSINFDWAEDTVVLKTDFRDYTLPWADTGQTDDGLASVLEYGSIAETNSLLRIEASGLDITAYFTRTDPGITTWVATCDVRQAA